MTEKGKLKASTLPSANWLALRKKLSKSSPASTQHKHHHARKRRKLDHASSSPERTVSPSPHQAHTHAADPSAFPRGRSLEAEQSAEVMMDMADEVKNGESLLQLRKMVLGQIHHTPAHTQPGKYVAIDCEMVGVGIDGEESALARVSLVNFYGAVLLDAFVRPRERVVDYRTQYSGIRPSDMVHAKSFEEVQKQVADLLEDRILVGHAVHNDLKALLLSHPRPLTRDTQSLSHKHKLPSARGRRPALRHLVQSELGLTIQSGEHSSVTDARATMALFRLHRKEWEKDFRPAVAAVLARARSRSRSKSPARAAAAASASVPSKRARRSSSPSASVAPDSDEDDAAVQPAAKKPKSKAGSKRKSSASSQNEDTFPGGGRRGVSSGLSTVIKRAGGAGSRSASAADKTKPKPKTKEKWWKDLGGGGSSGGSKGSMRLKVGR